MIIEIKTLVSIWINNNNIISGYKKILLKGEIKMPELSIIVPIYKAEKYLPKCIESVLNQTLKDFELILVNDGSPDRCGRICEEYAEKDGRIKVIHKKNNGVSSARNRGLEIATGEYIGFVDADDWIDSDMYERLIRELELTHTDICIGGFKRQFEDHSEIIFQKEPPQIFKAAIALEKMLEWKLFRWELADKVYKRKLFAKLKFDENIGGGEDLLINWELFHRAEKVAYFPIYAYHYVVRKDSTTQSDFSAWHLTYLDVLRSIRKKTIDSPEHIKKMLESFYGAALVSILLKMLLFNAVQYKVEIKSLQKEIRKNFLCFLFGKNISIRQRMGIIYFFMPYAICKLCMTLAVKK